MKLSRLLVLPILAAALAGTACGDIGRVVLDVQFPDEDTERQTRALEVVVRERRPGADGCTNVWPRQPTNLAEGTEIIPYPNRVDVRGSPVAIEQYPDGLTFLVYAYPTSDIEGVQPLAAGCVDAQPDPSVTTEIAVELQPI